MLYTMLYAAIAAFSPGQEVTVQRTPSGCSLALGASAPFHRTTAEVTDLAQCEVPDSGGLAVTWNERGADGALTAHYAISLDGQNVIKSTATDYVLRMRRGSFDPLVAAPNFAGSMLPPGGDVYLVQFITQPLDGYRTALERLGATIHHFVANHAYIVRMSAPTSAQVALLPFVRWVGPYHPEYRLDEQILAGLAAGTLVDKRPYNVQVFEQGLAEKLVVAQRVQALGGVVDDVYPGGNLLQASMDAGTLTAVASMDEVVWIDPWGPGENDMDIARTITGANYIQTMAGFTGQGVRGEVFDDGFRPTHQEFQVNPLITHNGIAAAMHGTNTSGEVFSTGVNATARGMLPAGQGIISSYTTLGDRVVHSQQLVQSPYFAVFQTNSWGDPRTTQYTSKSQEMDQIIFLTDLIITQSQSNAGNQDSRPQAWAKNVVSIGGIKHMNTLSKVDDNWTFGGSIGPAADGRIKPDLSGFYDNIFTTTNSSNTAYITNFGGTSGATPICGGSFGLFFQMWHSGIFGNTPGATVFDSRPHSTTAKAFMINSGQSYTFSGTAHDLTRMHQGWGLTDLQRLYDNRNNFYWINETDVLTNLQTAVHNVDVAPGQPEFRATLVYLDKEGTTSVSQHRINDLTLKVTAPGGAIYWGNNGLNTGNFSTAGGSANTKDTVENVFVQNPPAGTWMIEVIASEVNVDTHTETGAMDADYALVVHPVVPSSSGFCTAKAGLACGLPAINSTGTPSATALSGFTVTAAPARGQRLGFLLYNTSQVPGVPFAQTGTLCVNPMSIRRAGIVGSFGTNNQCDGAFTIDMNAFAHGVYVPPGGSGVTTPAPYLVIPGTVVFCQMWGRDTVATGDFLSDGVSYTIQP